MGFTYINWKSKDLCTLNVIPLPGTRDQVVFVSQGSISPPSAASTDPNAALHEVPSTRLANITVGNLGPRVLLTTSSSSFLASHPRALSRLLSAPQLAPTKPGTATP